MAEWPKTLEEDMGTYKEYYDVIRADLGRAQHEALRGALTLLEPSTQRTAVELALARYEQEVDPRI